MGARAAELLCLARDELIDRVSDGVEGARKRLDPARHADVDQTASGLRLWAHQRGQRAVDGSRERPAANPFCAEEMARASPTNRGEVFEARQRQACSPAPGSLDPGARARQHAAVVGRTFWGIPREEDRARPRTPRGPAELAGEQTYVTGRRRGMAGAREYRQARADPRRRHGMLPQAVRAAALRHRGSRGHAPASGR